MKVFRFEERIKTVITQYYEVVAETEEEALALVQAGHGFQEAFTEDNTPGELELYDVDELDDDPNFTDSAGFSIADREDEEEGSHHCDDPSCNCSI
jgi:hypothetical protein